MSERENITVPDCPKCGKNAVCTCNEPEYHASVPDYWGFALCDKCAKAMNAGTYKTHTQWCFACNESYISFKRHSGEVITDNNAEIENLKAKLAMKEKRIEAKTQEFAGSCKMLDERNQELEEQRDALKRYGAEDQKTIESLKAKIESMEYGSDQHDLICSAFGVEPDPAKPGDTAYEYVCSLSAKIEELEEQLELKTKDFTQACKVFGEHNQELEKEVASWNDLAKRWQSVAEAQIAKHDDLMQATNGHTLENVREIMKAAPPAEILKGSRLEVKCSGETMKTGEVAMWAPCIYVYPIVEYIEGDEITDELVLANGGRVQCETATIGGEWVGEKSFLVAVDRDSVFWTMVGDRINAFNTCRIKKSDLKKEI